MTKIKRERSSSTSFSLETNHSISATATIPYADARTGIFPVKEEAMEDSEEAAGLPKQRRWRLVFDGVEIPMSGYFDHQVVPKAADAETKLTKAEMKAQIDATRNPKVKKDERREFSIETIYRRLATIRQEPYPVDLPPVIRDTPVKRIPMSKTYGGSFVDTFPCIASKRLAVHGYDNFMYISPSYNPNAPQVPGYPGLYYECCDFPDEERAKIRRLFFRVGDGWWLYLGQYRLARAEDLTKEEWNSQTPAVKANWGKNIRKKSWGQPVRARIAFRKRFHRNPNATELANAVEDKNMTSDEIIRAYNRGKERIAVWTMECVGYDETFQREIYEKFRNSIV